MAVYDAIARCKLPSASIAMADSWPDDAANIALKMLPPKRSLMVVLRFTFLPPLVLFCYVLFEMPPPVARMDGIWGLDPIMPINKLSRIPYRTEKCSFV